MKMYVNISFRGKPVGETMLFTDESELMQFIKAEMVLERKVIIRPEAELQYSAREETHRYE